MDGIYFKKINFKYFLDLIIIQYVAVCNKDKSNCDRQLYDSKETKHWNKLEC